MPMYFDILKNNFGINFERLDKRFSDKYIYDTASVSSIPVYAMRLIKQFVNRLLIHDNELIKTAVGGRAV